MTDAAQMTGLLDEGFKGLEEKVKEIVEKFNAGVEHINNWRWVLGPFMIGIKSAMEKVSQAIGKLVELVKTAVQHHMPVVSLIVQSFNWIDHVQAPVNQLVYVKTDLAYEWEGKAAAKYQDKAAGQNDALNAIATKADSVSKWLMEIAQYNIQYMTELSKMVTGFLGKVVTAAIDAATVVELPFTVDKLSGAIGDLVTQELDNLVGIAQRFVEVLSKVRDIKSMMTDPKLPQGNWPQAIEG